MVNSHGSFVHSVCQKNTSQNKQKISIINISAIWSGFFAFSLLFSFLFLVCILHFGDCIHGSMDVLLMVEYNGDKRSC